MPLGHCPPSLRRTDQQFRHSLGHQCRHQHLERCWFLAQSPPHRVDILRQCRRHHKCRWRRRHRPRRPSPRIPRRLRRRRLCSPWDQHQWLWRAPCRGPDVLCGGPGVLCGGRACHLSFACDHVHTAGDRACNSSCSMRPRAGVQTMPPPPLALHAGGKTPAHTMHHSLIGMQEGRHAARQHQTS